VSGVSLSFRVGWAGEEVGELTAVGAAGLEDPQGVVGVSEEECLLFGVTVLQIVELERWEGLWLSLLYLLAVPA
jgi:hypothetical protein